MLLSVINDSSIFILQGKKVIMTKTIDVHEATTHFSDLLIWVREGTEVIVTEGANPFARIIPIAKESQRTPGLHVGAIQMSSDFDAPLPEAFWMGADA